MIVEIILIQPLWDFNITIIFLQVIWAIGLSMVVLAVLQFLPVHILTGIGLLIVFSHNLLDSIRIDNPFWSSVLWSIIHQQYFYQINDRLLFVVMYPFLPWLGLMILGYVVGQLYLNGVDSFYRRRTLRIIGLTTTVLFVAIRAINIYGDMHPWKAQMTTIFTILDFINTSKYPPSLLYILMTIGPALIVLSYIEKTPGSIANKIIVFGKVPFFYYVLHVFLIHTSAWLLFFATGHSWSELDFDHFRNGSLPFGSGHDLWVVFAVWMVVVVILYFPCRWYAKYKSTHQYWWLSYI
jgi:uncharacterized membrane protein